MEQNLQIVQQRRRQYTDSKKKL